MKKLTILTLATFCLALQAGTACAQSAADSGTSIRSVQVAVVKKEAPVMTYEVANMIKMKNEAEAQYRRTGSAQDLARVKVIRKELASRGYGQATQQAPYPEPVLAGSHPSVKMAAN